MTAFRRHRKRKLKSEINVVPYIDVMLVLLIIFMVTAPLLNLGVDIELPQSNAKSLQEKGDPIIVSVDAGGGYTLRLRDGDKESVDAGTLVAQVKAYVDNNPNVVVYVAGDTQASYDTVYQAMVLLQTAGVSKIGLMSKPPEGD
jgi:biopolymer transport protein TolR